MSIKKDSGRQEVIAAIQNINFGTGSDVAVQGVFAAIDLPANSYVTDGYIVVSDATTAAVTIALGDAAVPTRYLAATAADAVAKTNLTITGFKNTAATTLNVTVAGANPVAVGKATIVLHYVVEGRAAFSQG